ncbi:MAG: hypothetical protein CME58_11575 [Halieaceae bacterium]|nr:hypothetical protein [Halieaceae bacterium]|tara:strand:- start:207 stop:578 length:372 start_codon:yes stop_codon:yes gene_type:complete
MTEPSPDDQLELQRKAKGKRPFYFSNPDVDKLLSMIMALTGELAIARDRIDTLERVAETKGLFSSDDIENFELDANALQARADRHRQLLREVNRIIVGELEDLEGANEEDYTAVVEQVEQDDT